MTTITAKRIERWRWQTVGDADDWDENDGTDDVSGAFDDFDVAAAVAVAGGVHKARIRVRWE